MVTTNKKAAEPVNKVDEVGQELVEMLRNRDVNPGGHGIEILGGQGSGKTSLMLNFVEDFSRFGELMFWRESVGTPLQFVKYPRWEIFVERGTGFRIIDQNNDGQEFDYPVEYFDEIPEVIYHKKKLEDNPDLQERNRQKKQRQDEIFEDIFERAEPGHLNVIFFKRKWTWIDFLRFCKMRPSWQDIFIDEYEDIFPSYNKGEDWYRVEWAQENFKHIRKGLVNVFLNTQNSSGVDYRIRNKMTMRVYLPGSVPESDSPVKKYAVSNLNVGQGFIAWMKSKFGKIRFKPFESDEEVFYVAQMDSTL